MKNDFIYDLTEWIESQLASKLSLDIVAAKSGYSKWYLQRVYHALTGVTLSRYIRLRKLSAAAAELQITKTHILDISLKYGFTTQQAFTRSFKSYFHQTPARYRNNTEWDCSQLYPPYQRIIHPVPKPDIISLPEQIFLGIEHSFPCAFEDLCKFNIDVRMNFFNRYLRDYQELPSYVYGISHFEPNIAVNSGIVIKYFTATDYQNLYPMKSKVQKIIIPEGHYAQFNYSGTKAGFQQFIMDVNRYHLPRLDITRRRGNDIERYFLPGSKKHSLHSSFITCSYLVPCADVLHKSVSGRFM
ncbi:hypothetical protein A3780_14420 [Kosakonia radicincitans]|uniref:helix-turn-helix domain-containing protein n=1 Tax=Kosakonia radicincitans TaxID=283686 RepID=UPI0009038681|nr:helix-turn-helix domain-containing protein [Kosakonia radicincitans]APG18700.1 hypothetical protein A3780_14420 [Kosakonia radicincitans]